jgi:predicted O-linked N-acetylglucosamine transferase (SPINDLY family)
LKIYTKLAVAEPNNCNKANYHYYNARVLQEKNSLNEAFREYISALKYNQKDNRYFLSLAQLANLYSEQMLFDSAQLCHAEIAKYRTNAFFHSFKTLSLLYDPKIDAQTLFSEYALWGKKLEDEQKPVTHFKDQRPLHQKLRIGYVSSNYRLHPVAYFIRAILKNHDQANFTVYLYADVKNPDVVTEKIKTYGHIWRDFSGKSDRDLLKLILEDEIDILVDLSGHTGNSVRVFACKPAPIVITYLDCPHTTGLSRIDYFLTDEYADPTGITDKYYTEELFRLPNSFLCYDPLKAPPINEKPPLAKNGYLTFGNYSSTLKKITPETIALWSSILREVEDARFIMRTSYLNIAEVRNRVEQLFENNGVDPTRIICKGFVNYEEHLASFNDLDIMLDPIRYSGVTSNCDALWMGVPVITLAGDMHMSRTTASLLSNIGLKNLVAATEKQYRQIAKELAKNGPLLKELRRTLRQKMILSPVMDGASFTKNLENAYLTMWQRWLEG